MPRIAIFTDNDFRKTNGLTTTLKAVLRFSTEFEVRVFTAEDEPVDRPGYLAIPGPGTGLPWYPEMRVYWPRVRRFTEAVREFAPDVIHVTTPGPIGVTGRIIARRLGIPLVGSYHTNFGDYVVKYSRSRHLGRVVDGFMRWLYAPCDPIFVPSGATASLLTCRGYDPNRLCVWGRGVDTDRFSPARRSTALRESWQVPDETSVFLYAGRVSSEKGLDLMAPLRARLDGARVRHRFVFVGDGPMRAALERACPDAVFPGSLPHDEVGLAMASADAFIFPSATDTLGNVVLEALASGLPAIVTDQGGPRSHVRPGETGFVCPADSVEAFADATTVLARDPALRRAMSAHARAYALTQSWIASLKPLHDGWRSAMPSSGTEADQSPSTRRRTAATGPV